MPQMKLNRDHVLVTNSGLSFGFKKGVPLFVPRQYVDIATMLGAEPCDEDTAVEAAAQREQRDAEAAKAARRGSDIEAAIKMLVDRNMPSDFTAGGKPNMKAVESIVGYDCSRDEVDHVFSKVKAELNQA